MELLKKFLLVDGIIVVIGLMLIVRVWQKRMLKDTNHFKENLWDPLPTDMPKEEKEKTIDERILIGHKKNAGTGPATEKEKPSFQLPNFHGKAHQILGVPEESNKELVLAAYRHWIKRYHPDRVTHMGPEYVEQARKRAEQLNKARDTMLAKLAAGAKKT